MRQRTIRFRRAARNDLFDLTKYSFETFGTRQTERYVRRIFAAIHQLAKFPYLGTKSKRSSLRIFPVMEHVVLYEIEFEYIEVVRIAPAKALRKKL
ncbi:MAG: type II toxin-antitoxin system RelE/ParE family toxin [Schleiferiaceae bacterium]